MRFPPIASASAGYVHCLTSCRGRALRCCRLFSGSDDLPRSVRTLLVSLCACATYILYDLALLILDCEPFSSGLVGDADARAVFCNDIYASMMILALVQNNVQYLLVG